MFDDFASRVENIDDVDIDFVIGGSGPPLLMLHGYPQTRALWARVAPQLADRFTVVCADLRGYGASAKPPAEADSANYSFRALASDQLGLMRPIGTGISCNSRRRFRSG
jgi:haloacetate dehalogenase